MKTSEFDYNLPSELIAQEPLPERTQSRMMVIDRAAGLFKHRQVADIGDYLESGDLLVLNNTKVFPARLFGKREGSGGKIEILLVEKLSGEDVVENRFESTWSCFLKAGRSPAVGTKLELAGGRVSGEMKSSREAGRVVIGFRSLEPLMEILDEEGVPPVPPYIKRGRGKTALSEMDKDRYQTVFARHSGAVAAPTAGLHFTPELLSDLKARGVRSSQITLHVGPGTFLPVRTDTVEEHAVEAERYILGSDAADCINKAEGRIIAVGSTSVRTLESASVKKRKVEANDAKSSLFIYPPYEFRVVEGMLTNFHLPQSSLLMMVMALGGKALIKSAYEEAVKERYRFYSYGDCMLIL